MIFYLIKQRKSRNDPLYYILDNLKAKAKKIFTSDAKVYDNLLYHTSVCKDFDLIEITKMSDAIFQINLFAYDNIKRETNDRDYITIHLRYKKNGEEVAGHM